MKKNYYIISEEVQQGVHLVYNVFSNIFLLLNHEKYNLFCKECEEIEKEAPDFFQQLLDEHFIIDDDYDELAAIKYRIQQLRFESSMYHLMVNTTLDCNLNCWYCYENRIKGSHLEPETIEIIKKNIALEYQSARYNTLKVSFFGGEPFLDFDGLKAVLDFARVFTEEHDIELIADFTTNATLICQEHIDYLKDLRCHFQITLDGDREVHNRVKKDHNKSDTYQKTLNALKMINEQIPNRWLAVRINFDNRTLGKIDEILNDIDFLDRKSTYVILKKVWQVDTEKVNKSLMCEAMQKIMDKKFQLDYYVMPKGCVCFAERKRMTLFNYDGKVFKCSTISSFDDENALGKVDEQTGFVSWDEKKTPYWYSDMMQKECEKCKWLPACLGPCNRQLMAHKGKFICTFDSMNLDEKEYLVYLFKYNMLLKEIYK